MRAFRTAAVAASLACALAPAVASADPFADPPCRMWWEAPTVGYEDGYPRYVYVEPPQWVC